MLRKHFGAIALYSIDELEEFMECMPEFISSSSEIHHVSIKHSFFSIFPLSNNFISARKKIKFKLHNVKSFN